MYVAACFYPDPMKTLYCLFETPGSIKSERQGMREEEEERGWKKRKMELTRSRTRNGHGREGKRGGDLRGMGKAVEG